MSQEVLQKAIDALRIRDVFLSHSQCNLAEGFDARYSPEAEHLMLSWKHLVRHTENAELIEDGKKTLLFRVGVDCGVVFAIAREPAKKTEKKTTRPDDICARIEALFTAEYEMRHDPGEAALQEFALKNASFHIWPYWREYLTSQCQRMNLPKIIVPAVQFARNSKSGNIPAANLQSKQM